MHKPFIHSPLLRSHALSRLVKRKIYLKCEALQHSGSFKDRGIGALCRFYAKQGVRGLVCSSGGNAGLAVAYASQVLNLPATVVIPTITSKMMIEKIKAERVNVIIEGDNWNQADVVARRLAEEQHYAYIPPFDHPVIWQGYTAIIDELKQDMDKPDAIIVSVGGGGLFSGLCLGLQQIGWDDVAIITAETEGAATLATSVEKNERVVLEKLDTIAVTLAAKQICEQAFEWTTKWPVFPQTVSDKAAVNACLRFADDHRMMVEPACGAALAVIYDEHPVIEQFDSIVVIVCGGSGVTLSQLNQWSRTFELMI